VDLEIQVKDEHDYPERSLFNWAREYSTALGEGAAEERAKWQDVVAADRAALAAKEAALADKKTEEELKQTEALEAPIIKQAIRAYRDITATNEFRTIERMRSDARRNEASALYNARREAAAEERVKWQDVVAADKAALADKDAALADKAAEIARLRAQLGEHLASAGGVYSAGAQFWTRLIFYMHTDVVFGGVVYFRNLLLGQP
jgi:hypothetical protein